MSKRNALLRFVVGIACIIAVFSASPEAEFDDYKYIRNKVIVADRGYALFPSIAAPVAAGSVIQVAFTINELNAMQINLPFQLKAEVIQVYVDVAGTNFGCGVYSADGGTLLLETGAIDVTSTGLKKVTLGTPVLLDAGIYWYAWTADNTATRIRGISLGGQIASLFSDTNEQMGYRAAGGSEGTLPSSLGSLTYALRSPPFALVKP